MYKLTLLLPFLLVSWLQAQTTLDTIKVYNVYCSYSDGNTYSAWGGNFTAFYPTEPCPENNQAFYIENRKAYNPILSSNSFCWIKLYNTADQLIYEGLKYSDCTAGPFICYWPNGQVKITGEYGGYKYSEKKGYQLKKCTGKETGTWTYFNESGEVIETVKY